jgi:hypothetical protein
MISGTVIFASLSRCTQRPSRFIGDADCARGMLIANLEPALALLADEMCGSGHRCQDIRRVTMIRRNMVLRTLGVMSILLASGSGSYADSCSAQPKTQSASSDFEAQEATLKEREAKANHDYEDAKALCRAEDEPRACLLDAEVMYDNEQISIAQARNRNDATRTKAGIDALAANEECKLTGETPAIQQENRRHYEAQVDIKKRGVDVETDYKNAVLDCRRRKFNGYRGNGARSSDTPGVGVYGNQGPGCVKDAGKDYAKAKAQLQVATNDENYNHDRNLIALRKGQPLPKP